jgi:PIN domain
MSNLLSSNNQKAEYKHLLVFDTIALLSADEANRIEIWRNNLQLGECYIPGATHAEISNLANNYSNPKEQVRAKTFLNFQSRESLYIIQPVEDNHKIPLDNKKDRQILTCAYRLASENPNCVVILVTYDASMQSLVKQSNLPNFCYLNAREIGEWYNKLYPQKKVPKAISQTYERIKKISKNDSNFQTIEEPQKNIVNQNKSNNTTPRIIQQTPKKSIHKPSKFKRNKNTNNTNYVETPILKPKKQPLYPLFIGIGVICLAFGAFFTVNNITSKSSAIVAQQQVDTQQVKATPPNLIANAEAAIIQFQETKEPSILRNSLNELQTQKNKQGLRLDKEGEQRLSRLKHKYAIEVLASSGQKAEAAKMLQEISKNYSDYKEVKKSLAKLKK